jgi:glyoxylase-like metal-dependent hydrolase (beta-lactamase superfamily II)
MAESNARFLTKIGRVEVYIIPEITIPTSVRWLLPEASREMVESAKGWLQPHFMDENGYLLQSIHTYVLKTHERTILIDTGVGNGKARGGGIPAFNLLDTPFLKDLASIGVKPEQVDAVLCTHIHTDHVGWNARLSNEVWTPTFTNARHVFARVEYETFASAASQGGANHQLWKDSIEPVVEAGLVDLVPADHQVTPEIRLEPSHGHTDGHVSIRIDSGRDSAVFTGDVMHSPLQIMLPRMRCALGGPERPAMQARIEVLDRYADSGTPVFGAHFADPCGGFIKRDGEGFRFEAID